MREYYLAGLLATGLLSAKALPPRVYRWTLAPSAPLSHQAYNNASERSWGGSVVHVVEDAEQPFHMYAMAMVSGCNLEAWKTNTKVVHLAAPKVTGPYHWKDDALPCCGHIGPGAVRHPDGTFLLFSWNDAVHNASGAVPCKNGFPASSPAHNPRGGAVHLHTSTTPHGPWVPVLNPSDGTDVLWRAVNPNPTPLVLANGTVVVLGGGLWVADHWKGPYVRRAGLQIPSSRNCSADPRAHRSGPSARHCNCSAAGCVDADCVNPDAHCAAEDQFLYFWPPTQTWRYLDHQKLDDAVPPLCPRNDACAPLTPFRCPGKPCQQYARANQCAYFPYTVGYAESVSDDLFGEWRRDFWRPAAGLHIQVHNETNAEGGLDDVCLEKRERPKLFQMVEDDGERRAFLVNGVRPPRALGTPEKADFQTLTFIQEVLAQ